MDIKVNYYEILGVDISANSAEIKSSYRKLARQYHPDVCGNNEESVAKFKKITEAYEVLSDSAQKQKYDMLKGIIAERKARQDKINSEKAKEAKEASQKKEADKAYKNAREQDKQQGFSSVLNDILGGLKHKQEPKHKAKPKKEPPKDGEDITCEVMLTMLESINGCNKTVNILVTEPCRACNGRKFINQTKCRVCNGKGEEHNHKKITVKIPPAVKHGSKIRIPNEGNKGINGGKNGDLYLNVQIEASDIYKYDGLNINYTLVIPPQDAVLGSTQEINVPDGKVSMKVMAGTSQGQKYRLAKQGLKRGSKVGDLIVTIKIDIPKNLSQEEKDLYKKLQELANKETVK